MKNAILLLILGLFIFSCEGETATGALETLKDDVSTVEDSTDTADVVVDEPVDEPVVDEPVIDEPVIDEPVIDEPVIDKPVIDIPVVASDVKGTWIVTKTISYDMSGDVVEEVVPTETEAAYFLFATDSVSMIMSMEDSVLQDTKEIIQLLAMTIPYEVNGDSLTMTDDEGPSTSYYKLDGETLFMSQITEDGLEEIYLEKNATEMTKDGLMGIMEYMMAVMAKMGM